MLFHDMFYVHIILKNILNIKCKMVIFCTYMSLNLDRYETEKYIAILSIIQSTVEKYEYIAIVKFRSDNDQ